MLGRLQIKQEIGAGIYILLIVGLTSILIASFYPRPLESNEVIEVYRLDYLNSYLTNHRVLVIFSSETCLECLKLTYKYSELRQLLPSEILLIEIPLIRGTTDMIFRKYNIVKTPTFIVYDHGDQVARYDGLISLNPDEIVSWVLNSFEYMEGASGNKGVTFDFSPLGIIAPFILGALIAFSPCSLPFLFLVSGGLLRESRDRIKPKKLLELFLLFVAGLFSSLIIAVYAFSWLSGFVLKSLIFLGLFLIFTGLLSLFGRHIHLKTGLYKEGVRGLYFMSGFLALQCNLPIFLGAAALLSYSLTLVEKTHMMLQLLGLLVAYALALGIAHYIVMKIGKYDKVSRLVGVMSGVIFVGVGVVLLLF